MKDLYALFRQSLAGLRLLLVATVVCGLVYPRRRVGRPARPWRPGRPAGPW